MQTIDQYCDERGSIFDQRLKRNRPYLKADFARDMGCHPNQITKWCRDGWMVADGRLWAPKRLITSPGE